jgi:uncharacterized protein
VSRRSRVVSAAVLSSTAAGMVGLTASPAVAIATPADAVSINESHHDNADTDTSEAIEVAGTAGTTLSGRRLVVHNGRAT